MRETLYDMQFVVHNDKLIGLAFGADFCAEHEWGIKRIKQNFGIGLTKEPGIAQRQITNFPNDKSYKTILCKKKIGRKTYSCLYSGFVFRQDDIQTPADYLTPMFFTHQPREHKDGYRLSCAWDEESFGVVTDKHEWLEELYGAIKEKNVAIGLFGGLNPFSNSGLSIFLVDRLPQEVLDTWRESDQDKINLAEASNAIGIKDQIDYENQKALKNNGGSLYSSIYNEPFGYYALTPRWANTSEKMRTKYDVVYWLNPRNQDRVNYGWFTVEELEQWVLEGKGPIPKVERQSA